MKKLLFISIILLAGRMVCGQDAHDTLNRGTPSNWLTGDTGNSIAYGFCYSADSNLLLPQSRPDGAIDCGAILPFKSKPKSVKTQSIQTIDTATCSYRASLGDEYDQEGKYHQADSVLEWYVETCYDSGAAQAFGDLNGYGFGPIQGTPASYANFRNWLKTVLWLGPMYPDWYCECAQDIYQSYVPIDAGRNFNAALAVLRYLDSSGRCNFDQDESTYVAERHQVWEDTVCALHNCDSLDFPEDTTLPTIDDLGLSILRGPPAIVQQDTSAATGITNLTASENPFEKSTTISFETGEYSYLSFQVFDVLGRVVQGNYAGTVLQPGSYSFTVDGSDLPAGTYYARIATLSGETRMLKLVKE